MIFCLSFSLSVQLIAQKPTLIDVAIDSLENEVNSSQHNLSDYSLQNKLCFLYILHGDIENARRIIIPTIINQISHNLISDELFQSVDLLGDIYFLCHDINFALTIWQKNLSKKILYKGESYIGIAESYSKIARYHNFMMNFESAFYYGSKAINQLEKSPKTLWYSVNVPDIYRTFFYAQKIYENCNENIDEAIRIIDSMNKIMQINHPLMVYYLPVFVHDMGNLYTDITSYHTFNREKISNWKIKSATSYKNAIRLYAYEKHLRDSINSNPLNYSILYFTMALVNDYKEIEIKKNEVCLLYLDTSLSYLDENLIKDKYQIQFIISNKLDMLKYKSIYLKELYDQTKSEKFLIDLYENSNYSFRLFKKLLVQLKSDRIGKIFEVYDLFQFNRFIFSELEMYNRTKDEKFLFDAYSHSLFSKHLDLLKIQINNIGIKTNIDQFKIKIVSNIINRTINDSNTVVVDYFIKDDNMSYVFVFEKGNLHVKTIDKANVFNSINKFQQQINSQSDSAMFYLSELYRLLINPIENLLIDCETMYIVSSSILTAVPFDALIKSNNNDVKFLSDNIEIRMLNSMLLNNPFKVQKTITVSDFSLINPYYSKQSNLLFNSQMCDDIESKYNILDFKDLIKNNEYNHLSKPYILQISAHGSVDTITKSPYILLNENNKFTSEDVLLIKNPPILACIIACESGKGKIQDYEGSANMARYFALAGTTTSIITLWKVDDRATALIMENFYYFLENGLPVQSALSQAKLKFRKDYPEMNNPFYWAGIQAIGDNLVLKMSPKYNILSFILFFSSITLIFAIILLKNFFRK